MQRWNHPFFVFSFSCYFSCQTMLLLLFLVYVDSHGSLHRTVLKTSVSVDLSLRLTTVVLLPLPSASPSYSLTSSRFFWLEPYVFVSMVTSSEHSILSDHIQERGNKANSQSALQSSMLCMWVCAWCELHRKKKKKKKGTYKKDRVERE